MASADNKRWRAWMPLVAYVSLIYLSLPWMPDLFRAVKQSTGDLFILVQWLGMGLAGVILGALIYPGAIRRGWKSVAVVSVVMVSYVPLMYHVPYPSEKFHFAEYSFLPLIALAPIQSLHFPPKKTIIAVFVTGAMAGILDECIQWVLPMRHFDWHDIGFNVLAVAMGSVLMVQSGRVQQQEV